MPKRAADGHWTRGAVDHEEFFDEIGPIQAWLLGLLAADGSVKNKSQITFPQSGSDGKRLVETVRSLLGVENKLKYQVKVDSYSMNLCSEKIVSRLAEFGIVPRKSWGYEWPERLPPGLAHDFLRGYIDGDGCVGIYDHLTDIGTTTTWLLVSWCGTKDFVAQSNQVLPDSIKRSKIRHLTRNTDEVRYHGRWAVELGAWIWQDSDLPETPKKAIYDEFVSDIYPHTKYYFHQEAKRRATELLASGLGPVQVSERIGVSWSSVYRWIREGQC